VCCRPSGQFIVAGVLQCIEMCCNMLQTVRPSHCCRCVAVSLHYIAGCCRLLQYDAVCCSVLHTKRPSHCRRRVAVCCSVLQYAAVCCRPCGPVIVAGEVRRSVARTEVYHTCFTYKYIYIYSYLYIYIHVYDIYICKHTKI